MVSMSEKDESSTRNGHRKPDRPTVMQVLPTLETGGGGVERGAIDVAIALKEAGYGSLVVSAGGGMVRELDRAGVRHEILGVDTKSPLGIYCNISRLAALIRESGADIVHARSRAPAWSAHRAAKRCGVHFITTFHGTYSGTGNFLKKHYNSIMTQGERVIAISSFIQDHIRNVYGVEDERIRVIPRGIDLERFDPYQVSAERVVQLANDWRLPDGMPVIMLPGRLTRWKGQSLLIQALEKLGRRDIRCLLLGSDQGRKGYRQELESWIEKHHLGDVVHVVDHCADMPAAYMLADVVVSASTDPEAFGRVAAEAQAMGRLVAAPDHGGARETLLPGRTGWLFPPGDVDGLASVLFKALSLGPEERDAFAVTATEHVRKNFSKPVMCERVFKVYDEVMTLKNSRVQVP